MTTTNRQTTNNKNKIKREQNFCVGAHAPIGYEWEWKATLLSLSSVNMTRIKNKFMLTIILLFTLLIIKSVSVRVRARAGKRMCRGKLNNMPHKSNRPVQKQKPKQNRTIYDIVRIYNNNTAEFHSQIEMLRRPLKDLLKIDSWIQFKYKINPRTNQFQKGLWKCGQFCRLSFSFWSALEPAMVMRRERKREAEREREYPIESISIYE